MAELSKLQIRAKILSVISEIKTTKHYNAQIYEKLKEELSQIEDRSALFDIFIKEYIKLEENEFTFACILLKDLIDKEYLEEKVYKCLESKSYTDESKYKLIQLLRLSGNKETYDALPLYFENPEEIMDKETQNLLEKAVYNPESMLDFLDFIYSVQDNDKYLLINSLKADYNGDNLANIVYPILYSDFKDDFKLSIIDLISAAKSSLGIAPLNYLLETTNNANIKNAANKALKELKLAGATQKKANEYFSQIIEDSTPSCFFVTIPDGDGNQAILCTRAKDDGSIIFIATVINDSLGIIDCFGFYNISVDESCRIIAKFYKSEGKYKVSQEYAKTKIEKAIKNTIENKRFFPYEFICWNVFYSDIEESKTIVDELVETQEKQNNFTDDEVIDALTKEYTLRWFFDIVHNKQAKEMFNSIYKLEDYDVNEINSIIKNYINTIFDEKQDEKWNSRLKELVYLLNINNKENEAKMFSSILNKNTLFNTFKGILLQRTVFNNAVRIKQEIKTKNEASNIFTKKNESKEEYELKQIDKLIKELQKNWIYG